MVPSPRPLVSHRTRRAMGSRGGWISSPLESFLPLPRTLDHCLSVSVPEFRAVLRIVCTLIWHLRLTWSAQAANSLLLSLHTRKEESRLSCCCLIPLLPTGLHGQFLQLRMVAEARLCLVEGAEKPPFLRVRQSGDRLYTGFLSFEQCVYSKTSSCECHTAFHAKMHVAFMNVSQ